MGKKRRTFSDKFKAKVALEAVKGVKTIAQLATEHQVHPNQVSTWKRQLLENAAELFASGKSSKSKTAEEVAAIAKKLNTDFLTKRNLKNATNYSQMPIKTKSD